MAIFGALSHQGQAQGGLPAVPVPAGPPIAPVVSNFLSLSSGTPPPLTSLSAMVMNGGPGSQVAALPADIQSFNVSIDYGNLAGIANGQPAEAIVGLRVRGNVPYQVGISQISFTTSNLHYRGVEISSSQDNGSFIRLTTGTPVATGSLANLGGSQINPALYGHGLSLAQIAQGGVNFASTVIISGSNPSAGGELLTTGNAVEVPIFFLVPTGLALGPVNPNYAGSFASNLQFAIFPRP